MKKLALSALNDLFAAINAAETLYIPADDAAGQASFTRWQAGMQLSKKLNTVRSAKDLFFPQVENLMGFRVSEKQIELIEMRDETAPFVLFASARATRAALKFWTRSFWPSRSTPTIRPGANTARSSRWHVRAPRRPASAARSALTRQTRRAM